jgi:hypothetical protein
MVAYVGSLERASSCFIRECIREDIKRTRTRLEIQNIKVVSLPSSILHHNKYKCGSIIENNNNNKGTESSSSVAAGPDDGAYLAFRFDNIFGVVLCPFGSDRVLALSVYCIIPRFNAPAPDIDSIERSVCCPLSWPGGGRAGQCPPP